MNIFDEMEALSIDDRLDPTDSRFQMAFVLEDTLTSELLNDPKFVRWTAVYYFREDGEAMKQKEIPMRKCTD